MGHLYSALLGTQLPASPLLTILASCIPKWAYPTVPYSVFQRSVSNSFEFYTWSCCEQRSFHSEIGAKCCKWVALFLYQKNIPLAKPDQKYSFPTLCTGFDTETTMGLWGASDTRTQLLTARGPAALSPAATKAPPPIQFWKPRTSQSSFALPSSSLDIAPSVHYDHSSPSTCVTQLHILSSPRDPKPWLLIALPKPEGSQWDHSREHTTSSPWPA